MFGWLYFYRKKSQYIKQKVPPLFQILDYSQQKIKAIQKVFIASLQHTGTALGSLVACCHALCCCMIFTHSLIDQTIPCQYIHRIFCSILYYFSESLLQIRRWWFNIWGCLGSCTIFWLKSECKCKCKVHPYSVI